MAQEPASRVFMIQAKELFDAGKFSAAIMTLRDGLKQYPHFISARVLLGEIYWTSGEIALAKTELEQVIKAVPDNFAAHRKLAMIYREKGDLEAAIRSCRTVLQANPRDLEMRALFDQLHMHQVRDPGVRAADLLAGASAPVVKEPTAESMSSDAPIPPEPAVVLEQPGLEPVESAAPGDVDAASIDTETLAELYIVQGHREKGLSVYRRLAAKDPTNARFRERIEALEQLPLSQASAEEGREPQDVVSPSILADDLPGRNRRRDHVRRLEGWLQVLRTRRRS